MPNPCAAPQCDLNLTASIGGPTTAVARVGTTGLLVARGTNLEMFNLSNALAPAPFSPPRRTLMWNSASKISMSSGSSRAFLLHSTGLISCVTVTTSPQLLLSDVSLPTGLDLVDIHAEGDRVYAARSFEGFQSSSSSVRIYDRTSTNRLSLVNEFDVFLQGFIIDHIAKIGDVLWLATHQVGGTAYALEGWDVSNAAVPVRVGLSAQFATNQPNVTALHAIGNRLFLSYEGPAAGGLAEDRLRVADVSNPASVVWHPHVVLGSRAQCMSANGNQLRVCRGSFTDSWDTTNPAALTLLATFTDSPTTGEQITAGATADYLAVGRYGLRTVTFSGSATPLARALAATPLPISAENVQQSAGVTVVADNTSSLLRTLDLSAPDGQQALGSVALANYASGLEVTRVNNGATALALVRSEFSHIVQIFDFTAPAAPTLRASLILPSPRLMSVSNARLYILGGSSSPTLWVSDLTIPAAPTLLSTTNYGGSSASFNSIASWDSGATKALALGSSTLGLWLIDATNGANPQIASVRFPAPNAGTLAMTKGPTFLYVCWSGVNTAILTESINVASLANPIVNYASRPQYGQAFPGILKPRVCCIAAGKLLIGMTGLDKSMTVLDLNGPGGEGVFRRVLKDYFYQPTNGLAFGPSGATALLGAGDGGILQYRLPQSWPPGFSSPSGENIRTCRGGQITITASASANPTAITYQWFRGTGFTGSGLANGTLPSGTLVSGASTPTLNLSNIKLQEHNVSFWCIATNTCGSTTSSNTLLNVCAPDINCSGTVTVQDIFDFLTAWFAAAPLADFNGVGGVGVQDIFDFLEAWFAGCP